MKPRLRRPAAILSAALLLPGCAANQSLSSRDRSAVHRVAVDHAISAPGQPGVPGRVAGQVLRQGASYGLGVLGLGLVGGLAISAADIARSKSSNADISPDALRILGETKTDAGQLLAVPMEKALVRNGFTLDSRTPDAAIHFELQKLTLTPVDAMKLRQRPVLGVLAKAMDGKGRTVWSQKAVASAADSAARTWEEYKAQPALLRTEFETLAAGVARDLAAGLKK